MPTVSSSSTSSVTTRTTDTQKQDVDEIPGANPAQSEDKVKLKQRITLFNAVSIMVGCVVGSGIFVSPSGVLQYAGSGVLSLGVWLSCGIYWMLGALCYVELGTMIPFSGGDYTFILEAFGGLPAFMFLWISLVIVNPASLGIMGITCGQYMLQPLYPDSEVPSEACRLCAAAVIMLLILLNILSAKWSTRLQDVSTIGKVGALAFIIIAAGVYLARGNTQNLQWNAMMENSNFSPSSLALAFYSGVFSYSATNYITCVTEEIKDPIKNLPRTIYISVPFITVVYLLVNVAYFAVLTGPEIVNSEAAVQTFGERAMGKFGFLVPIMVVTSTIGSLNGILFSSSRMFFAGGRNGHLPELFSMINPDRKTPAPSVLVVGFLGIGYLFVDNLYGLINYMSFGDVATVIMSVAALLWMRFTQQDRPRPIKVCILIPIVFLVFAIYVLVCPFFEEPMELVWSAVMIISGIPVYFVFVFWQSKPQWLMKPYVYMTHGVQSTLLCLTGSEAPHTC